MSYLIFTNGMAGELRKLLLKGFLPRIRIAHMPWHNILTDYSSQ